MVFTISLGDLDRRFHIIKTKVTPTDSTRAQNGGPLETLPSGLLVAMSSTLVSNNAAAINLPRKGELYVVIQMLKNQAGETLVNAFLQGYLYRMGDLHWTGEMPIQDGDQLQISYRNSFASKFTINVWGVVMELLPGEKAKQTTEGPRQ